MIGLGPSVCKAEAEFSKQGHYCETILMAKVWYFGAYFWTKQPYIFVSITYSLTLSSDKISWIFLDV